MDSINRPLSATWYPPNRNLGPPEYIIISTCFVQEKTAEASYRKKNAARKMLLAQKSMKNAKLELIEQDLQGGKLSVTEVAIQVEYVSSDYDLC